MDITTVYHSSDWKPGGMDLPHAPLEKKRGGGEQFRYLEKYPTGASEMVVYISLL